MSATPPVQATPRLVRITIQDGLPGQTCAAADGVDLERDGWYVIETEEGERLGKLAGYELPVLRTAGQRILGTLVRRAGRRDCERGEALSSLAQEIAAFCRQRARELSLPVRPVSVHVPLDRDTVYLCYSAEERVDNRVLTKDLARRFHRRFELRQVGVRDQAKLCGGFGPCGRTLCCTAHMSRFSSITIRMAKAQRLSLNPTRISGMCGRLMCCLSHEMPVGRAPSKQRSKE
jgi:cell fate regulator YaaT (PSP1 superfamily)